MDPEIKLLYLFFTISPEWMSQNHLFRNFFAEKLRFTMMRD